MVIKYVFTSFSAWRIDIFPHLKSSRQQNTSSDPPTPLLIFDLFCQKVHIKDKEPLKSFPQQQSITLTFNVPVFTFEILFLN